MDHDRFGNPLRAGPTPHLSDWRSPPPAPFAPVVHWPREPPRGDPVVSPLATEVGDAAAGDSDAVAEAAAPAPSVTELRDELRRATAEVEAIRLRVLREAARAQQATRSDLVTALVPILDNLDRTLATGSADKALVQGVEMVRAQLEGVLTGYGLEPIVALGARFDPAEHEAVATTPVTRADQDGVIQDAFSRGYRFDGRVLVPARVRVGRLAGPQRLA